MKLSSLVSCVTQPIVPRAIFIIESCQESQIKPCHSQLPIKKKINQQLHLWHLENHKPCLYSQALTEASSCIHVQILSIQSTHLLGLLLSYEHVESNVEDASATFLDSESEKRVPQALSESGEALYHITWARRLSYWGFEPSRAIRCAMIDSQKDNPQVCLLQESQFELPWFQLSYLAYSLPRWINNLFRPILPLQGMLTPK